MIYKMKRERYNQLRNTMTHNDVINMLNDDLNLPVDDQKEITIYDFANSDEKIINFKNIGVKPMRQITNVIAY